MDSLLEGVFFSHSEAKLADTDTPTLPEFPEEERESERKKKEERERGRGRREGENPRNLTYNVHVAAKCTCSIYTCMSPIDTHTHTLTHIRMYTSYLRIFFC